MRNKITPPVETAELGDRKAWRRSTILDAAFKLFLEHGYNNVGMADIIRESGGSLATAYQLFENKTGLLNALVMERFSRYREPIHEMAGPSVPPETALRNLSRYLLPVFLETAGIGLLSIIVAESLRNPAFGAHFKESNPEETIESLTEVFAEWNARGVMAVENPRKAAESYFALLLHRFQLMALCGLPVELTPEQAEEHVEHVVKMMCSRYAPHQED